MNYNASSQMSQTYTGFTENEVSMLCEKYERDFDKVKKWYDGY